MEDRTRTKLTHKANTGNVKQKVDEEKLKEIASLREILNKKLEEDAEKQVSGGKGVVVQPEWTQGKSKQNAPTEVVVTRDNLQESAAIRDEIKGAVKSGKYVKGDSESSTSQADHYLGLKFRSKNVLANMVGSQKENLDADIVGSALGEEVDTNFPNIVESVALNDDIDIGKLKQLEMSSRRTREVLVVKEIVEDLSFNLGEDVKAWKHLEYDGREYYIGLRDIDLLIVQKDAMKYENGTSCYVGSAILHLETFNYWNTESEKQEGIIIIVTNEKLIWYQVHSADVYWEWYIGIPIKVLLYFKIGNSEYLALSTDQSSSLSVYQFDLRSKEFWIAQKLNLEGECLDIAFLDTGRDTVLAVVQKDYASIFTFNPFSEEGAHLKFVLKNSIQSEGIQTVSGFRMGGYSYLAVGGLSPKILHYSQGEFIPKTILGQNFGLVEMFLPIPARTYRDDMFLLVQHRVDFESHALVVLDTLVWDGEVFDAIAPAPCTIGNYTFFHDISCLLDVQRDTGIRGSAILRKDDSIFILVPRDKAESGLFQIKTELFAKNSELMDLKEIFSFLKEWVNEHDETINNAVYLLENDEKLLSAQTDVSSNYSRLRAAELYFSGEIGQIYLNEHEWTDEDMRIDLDDLVGEIERLDLSLGNEGDIIRHRRELTYDTLDFENMETEDLVFQLLNGEKAYLKNSDLIYNTTVSFDALWVKDEIRLSSARSVRDTVTKLNEDLEFEKINGIKWSDFSNDFILRNNYFEIEELHLVGEIVAEGDTTVESINGVRFPDDFLWSSGPQASIVQAEKHFASTLTANAVDTGGLLNNVNPFDIISLSEIQNISGLTTFTQLEVSERMNVNGTVQGRGLTKFLSNPSLLDSNIIHSACTFHHLEVRGPILISEKYNNINIDQLLKDVVYHETIVNEEISIPSHKKFNSIEFFDTLQLRNNNLNNIPLKAYVTKNTNQSLSISNISGNAYFNNVTINGQFDTVDIGALLEKSVHADSETYAEVKFTDICWAKSIQISETVNSANNFSNLQQNLNFETVEFGKVFANNLSTECEIKGKGNLNTNSPHARSGNGHWKVHVEELILKSGLQTRMLNNVSSKSFISFVEHVDDIPKMIWEGKIIVNHIHTDGDVQVKILNNQNFDDDIQMCTIWLNRPNYLQTNLSFENPITINGDLFLTGALNEQNLTNILQDIIFKSDTVILKTEKKFTEKVQVTENSQVESVNNIPFMEIATKQTVERFRGNVYINNVLSADNLDLLHSVNGKLNNFGKFFRFDEKMKTLVLLGEIDFKGEFKVESLHIYDKLNLIGNVNEFFENIVYKNNICMLKGRTIFKNDVNIEKGAYVRSLNGYNLVHLIKNIVFVNSPDPILISASVVFKDAVQVKDLTVKGSLSTSSLDNCILRDWIEDTLRTDKSTDIDGILLFAPGVINNNFLHAIYLNKLDLEYVVKLQTSQNISDCMSFSNIYLTEFLESDLINGLNLKAELQNTVMVDGNDHITAPLTISSCSVGSSFFVNGEHSTTNSLRDVVNLTKDLDINFPIYLKKIRMNQVYTNSSINGINFDQWQQNSLLTKTRENIITGKWSTRNLKTGFANVGEYSGSTEEQRQIKGKQNIQLYQSFNRLCQRSEQLVEKARNRISSVKYLTKSFSVNENEYIKKVFFVEDANRNYLIINMGCLTKILVWKVADEEYILLSEFHSGLIDEILMFPAQNNTFYLVTKGDKTIEECAYFGLNTWFYDQEKIIHVKSFGHSDISMIQPSSTHANDFYAISENSGKILQMAPNSSEEHTWDLPISGSESYRFLPHDAELGVAISNGHHILVLNQPLKHQVQRKRRSSIKFESNAQSTKSSFDKSQKWSSVDFFQVLERILLDLMSNLNILLLDNDTMLSDEREQIYNDLISIEADMIQKQFLPPTALHLHKLQITHNSSIIFVGKTVRIIWPVIKQISTMQESLENSEFENKICGQILKELSSAMNEIFEIGRSSLEKHLQSNTVTYTEAGINQVKNLQKEISDSIYKIKAILQKSKPLETEHVMSSEVSMQYLKLPANISTSNPLEEPFIGQSILESNFLVANSPHLPVRGKGEIVSIKTGINGKTRTLIATTEISDTLLETEINSIKIYFDVVTGSLYQKLSANKPKCLLAFRVQNESFLAFVENTHTIRVLVYKGIRGFIDFLKFEVHEPVHGLNAASVKSQLYSSCLKHFLVANSRNKIDFYEMSMTGHCSLKKREDNCSVFET